MVIDLRDKRGLLIDDVPEMRTTVRIQLADAGLEKCDTARNVKEAIDRIAANRYDLIVCDYNLGQGADGQQLLELLRRRQILPLTTAFLMITGETAYEQVSTAAEFAPDDYLIKPFTSATLRTRLERILEKKAALAPVYRHMGERADRTKALEACEALLASPGRYALDLARLKGELLLGLGRPAEALAVFERVLVERSTPWAEVGRARALAAAGDEAAAKERLTAALAAYPNYLAGYDTLADLLRKEDARAAQAVVEQALKVAPSTRRQRQLGALALDNGDFGRAEEAYRRAIEKDRTGFFKSHDDYAGLAKSCAEQGKTEAALAAVKEMGNAFAHSPQLAARQAAVESLVHSKSGDPAAAAAALERALAAQKEGGLDPATSLDLAQACFAAGKQDEARRIIEAVAEEHHENDAVFDRAQAVFAAAGLGSEGAELLEATRKRMIKLNNDAVALAKAGRLEEAIAMLEQAADRLVANCQVALNAAIAQLMHIQRHGPDPARLERARRHIAQARAANPEHARLPEAEALLRKISPADAGG